MAHPSSTRLCVPALCLLVLALGLLCAEAKFYSITSKTSNWQSILEGLKAGDVANISSGTYVTGGDGFFQLTLKGAVAHPIIIQAAPGPRPIIKGNSDGVYAQNVVNFQGSNFRVSGIAFEGGSKGVRLGPATVTNAIFDKILISGTTGSAFTANDGGNHYNNITLSNSEITSTNTYASTTGECVYVGCESAACNITNSFFVHNYCHDTQGSVGGSRAGFQVKTGSYGNLISNNVCYNTVGPCIVVYDAYTQNSKLFNVIDGNVAIKSGTNDVGIQASAGAIISNNIIINSNFSGIGIFPNQLEPGKNVRYISIIDNTVYLPLSDACLRLDSPTTQGFLVANNVFYGGSVYSITCATDLTGFDFSDNAINGVVYANGMAKRGTFNVGSASSVFINAGGYNFYPAKKSLLITHANGKSQSAHDFNAKTRSTTSPTVGAYQYSTATNPGKPVGNHFK